MAQHHPPHPGGFISEIYLEPSGLSRRVLAETLGVPSSTLSRVLRGLSVGAVRDPSAFPLLFRSGLGADVTFTTQ